MKKTGFVIGTGPSLKNIDMEKLSQYDCITFNRAYIAYKDWGFVPKYYLAFDGNDIRAMYKDINFIIEKYPETKFFILDDEHSNSIHPPESFQDGDKKDSLFDWSKPNLYRIRESRGYFSGLISGKEINLPVYLPNAGWQGIEVLYALGYDRIAFVGCDSKYRDDAESNKDITSIGREYISSEDTDINHFRPDYFGKGMRFGAPNTSQILSIWNQGSGLIPNDLKIISCTRNSAVNPWFEYVDFNKFY